MKPTEKLNYTKRIEHFEAVVKIFKENNFEPRTGVEIGVRHGDFAEYILRNTPSIINYYAVDPYLPYNDLGYVFTQDEQAEIARKASYRLVKYRETGKLTWVYVQSHLALDKIPEQELDFVFIDGEHTYEACLRDILTWAPKIKEGGLLMGHDYSMDPVQAAVKEWYWYEVLKTKSEILHTGIDSDVWAIRV